MTNRERYQKAASMIEPSAELADQILKEAKNMKEGTKTYRSWKKNLVAACAALVLVFIAATGTYAADVGGAREKVDTWLYGEPAQVEIIKNENEFGYTIVYPDGRTHGTGGMTIGVDGKEREMTIDEIRETLDSTVEIEEDENGRLILYYRDHTVDITDKLDPDGYGRLKFKDGLLPIYVSFRWQGDGGYGVSTSPWGYSKID